MKRYLFLILIKNFLLFYLLSSASLYNNTHRFNSQMQVQKIQQNTPIHGKNFQGMLHHHPDYLKITIIQSQHQTVHTCRINLAFMMQNPLVFAIFSSIDELFKELARNNNIEITDEKKLVINIDANYKDKSFHHCITLQTQELKFQSVIRQSQFLFEHLSEVNRYYAKERKIIYQKEKQLEMVKKISVEMQTPLPLVVKEEKKSKKFVSTFQLIIVLLFCYFIFHKVYFREIKQTQKIRIKYTPIPTQKFTIQKNGVLMNNINDWNAILHSQSLPNKGIYYYEFKVLETKNKYIMSGVCGKHISEETGSSLYYNKFFLSIYILNGNLYANGKAIDGRNIGFEIQSNTIGVQINLNDNSIIWTINKRPVFLAEIPKHLFNTKMNPCISMTTQNDKIQLVN